MSDDNETSSAGDPRDSLSAPVPTGPDDSTTFRLAQLTVLLGVAQREDVPVRTVDRLGIYDFLSANPFVVVSGGSDRDASDRLTLRLAGFSDKQLSYASTGQRFVSRRRRLQHDLSILVAYGLVTVKAAGYELTSEGTGVAAAFSSVYADSYRTAAWIVLGRLRKLSDRKLSEQMRAWLGNSWLLIDLYDDVTEVVPDVPREAGRRGRT